MMDPTALEPPSHIGTELVAVVSDDDAPPSNDDLTPLSVFSFSRLPTGEADFYFERIEATINNNPNHKTTPVGDGEASAIVARLPLDAIFDSACVAYREAFAESLVFVTAF